MSVVDLTAYQYHADLVADTPTLSASLAHVLLTKSPAHAKAQHPKLNPNVETTTATHFDIGTAVHDAYLQGVDRIHRVEADDWKTKAAREARDLARSHGLIPLLTHQADQVEEIAGSLAEQLPGLDVAPSLFTDGLAEQTLVWEEQGVMCRARLDWLRADRHAIDDLKTTSKTASPYSPGWSMFAFGGDTQAAFYTRGVRAVFGVEPDFRFLVVETQAPYALTVFSPGPDVMALADAKVDRAISTWRDCLERDEWPAYPTRVCHVDLPGWAETQWMQREAMTS